MNGRAVWHESQGILLGGGGCGAERGCDSREGSVRPCGSDGPGEDSEGGGGICGSAASNDHGVSLAAESGWAARLLFAGGLFLARPEDPNGPYINRGGQSNPANFNERRKAMIALSIRMPALTAAWRLTGRRWYGEQACAVLSAASGDSLIATVQSNPGIEIITLAPLTNLASSDSTTNYFPAWSFIAFIARRHPEPHSGLSLTGP
ncbi:MAG: alginate lyase family protein [Terracidiphilus sp.]